jgi:hypothetical protein
MGKTTQGVLSRPEGAPATRREMASDISLIPPNQAAERQRWEQRRKSWRQESQQRAKYWSQQITAAQKQGAGAEELRNLSAQAAQELIAERIDRWRNDTNGYDRLTQQLGLAGPEHGVSELISGQDQRPEFQDFALHFATQWLQEKALNGNKLTPGFLMEQVSHGANRAYVAELFQEVDDHPEKISQRIFGQVLPPEQLTGLQRVAGLAANAQVAPQRQKAEELPLGTSDFWYQVRKQWQDGVITNRQQLAEYTAEQIRRYG